MEPMGRGYSKGCRRRVAIIWLAAEVTLRAPFGLPRRSSVTCQGYCDGYCKEFGV